MCSRPFRRPAVLFAVVSIASACRPGASGATDPSLAVVEAVIDGDTIDVRIDGRHERVRLIGVDTPEVAHAAFGGRPANAAECFGEEARAFTEAIVPPGTEVRLLRDVVPRDDYGRLLAYVHLATDGRLVNLELVEAGMAQPLTIEPNTTHTAEFVEAARRAEAAATGLWSACRPA